MEAALERLFDERIRVTGAGRTDSGVHASGQVVSFSTDRTFPFERLAIALNAVLPPDCSVRDAAAVEGDFSARFSARERTYVYAILNRPQRSAPLARYTHHVARPLDLAAMRAAAAYFVGGHDFRPFCGSSQPGEPTVRTVARLDLELRGELIRIEISADGFLHHMVRIIIGTLLECGDGRRAPEGLPAMLAAAKRATAGPTAPAHGLWLAGVRYADGYDSFAEPPLFQGRGSLTDGQAFP